MVLLRKLVLEESWKQKYTYIVGPTKIIENYQGS